MNRVSDPRDTDGPLKFLLARSSTSVRFLDIPAQAGAEPRRPVFTNPCNGELENQRRMDSRLRGTRAPEVGEANDGS